MRKYWVVGICILAAVSADWTGFEYNENGEDWTGACATGSSQSPIDIEEVTSASSSDSSYRSLSINYQPTSSFAILDEGHNYKISGSFGQLKAEDLDLTGNYTFDSSQFHFHAPSEHQIHGEKYALEMNIVHTLNFTTPGNPLVYAEAGGVDWYVLGVLFKEGANNPMLADYISEGSSSISLYGLFSGRTELNNYYMYKGSLTTPPCTEVVNWYVFGEVQEASAEQIAFFTSRWQDNPNFAGGNGNNRQLQPLNGRTIIHFEDSTDPESS